MDYLTLTLIVLIVNSLTGVFFSWIMMKFMTRVAILLVHPEVYEERETLEDYLARQPRDLY